MGNASSHGPDQMKISAFTFARNVLRLGYPFAECLQSALGIADEVVVAVGLPDEDGTLDLVRGLGDDRVRVVETRWNPKVDTGGYVLAQQTNVALFNCTGDWAIYLQADEVLHEADYDHLRAEMARLKDDDRVEGLALRRLTFIGDLHTTWRLLDDDWPVRIVKPHRFVLSRGDAASFTVHPKYKERGRRVRAVQTRATVYHYGKASTPAEQGAVRRAKGALWREWRQAPGDGTGATAPAGPPAAQGMVGAAGIGRAGERPDAGARAEVLPWPGQFLARFTGTHPAVMAERVAADPRRLDLDSPALRTTLTRSEKRRWRKRWLKRQLRGWLRRQFLRSDTRFVRR